MLNVVIQFSTVCSLWCKCKLCPQVAYGSDNDKIYDVERDLWLGWEGRGEGEDGNRIGRDRPGVGQLGDKVYLVGGAGMRELKVEERERVGVCVCV